MEPVFFGFAGSLTSYCKNSPVAQHDTYKNLSSSDKLMSVIRGGTALKPFSSGGKSSASAGSAGISITFFAAHFPFFPLPSRYHSQIEPERSFSESTTPAKP